MEDDFLIYRCYLKLDHFDSIRTHLFLSLKKFFIWVKYLFKCFRITIISKILFPFMSAFFSTSSFYRTPIFFCSSSDLYCVGKKSVHIWTVQTVNHLHHIEIFQIFSIKVYVLRSYYQWYTIESHSSLLVEKKTDIKKNTGNNHPIYKRKRYEMSYTFRNDIFSQWSLKLLLVESGFLRKYNFPFFKWEIIFFSEYFIFFEEFLFLQVYFYQYFLDSWFQILWVKKYLLCPLLHIFYYKVYFIGSEIFRYLFAIGDDLIEDHSCFIGSHKIDKAFFLSSDTLSCLFWSSLYV